MNNNVSHCKSAATQTAERFQLTEGEANYIEFVDGNGFKFFMFVSWFGNLVTVRGKFGNMKFSAQIASRMIETVTYVSPIITGEGNGINSIRYAWASLVVPPFTRATEVQAYGTCMCIKMNLVNDIFLPEDKQLFDSRVPEDVSLKEPTPAVA